jgi:hypothetical protein
MKKSASEIIEDGFRSGKYGDNPYPQDSDEYDLFERGVTQKIKRSAVPDDGALTLEALLESAEDNNESIKTPKRSYKEMKDGE